ncbi:MULTISPECIES: substrate-binding domain-containing protein [Halanaerobium]|uniref:Substrate-binding protein-like domain-containing protein n=1 Tax=Halanaerobium kushneri TaxID=56779 RepID=A0A1N6VNB3_9FIRM|nr:substrate-binding domain-containing protein [Halanaerobium sp. ST460_2HS_T2]RCW56514.1 substrate-binding family protein [Halanaerobium sp. ST460_2HS_T2]SIQ79228.1 substrate-binding protein-like domain-containing protein [Halanaerobium kushneri]
MIIIIYKFLSILKHVTHFYLSILTHVTHFKQIKPALTTMKVRKVEMGKEAANLLFNKLNGNERTYPVKITVPTKLMLRDSTIKV